MKKSISVLLALALTVSLAGCAAKPAAPSAAPGTAGSNAVPEKLPEAPKLTWHYELTTKKTEGEAKNDEGVVLATNSYELPVLIAVCDDKASGRQPPAEVQKILDAFNDEIADYQQTVLTAATDIAVGAQEQYSETSEEYRQYFVSYYEDTEVIGSRIAGDLAEVCMMECGYWGGAHGAEYIRNLHFDLTEGKFVELNDLTDASARLRAEIAEDIIEEIYDRGEEDWYFDDFAQSIRESETYNVSFEEDGLIVIFGEYEIAPYASGMPEFSIPYEKISRFLNASGQRLLALSEETRILGDYYDALEMWYWFEGSAPLDYDDTRTVAYTDAYGSGEMPYYRFDVPEIETMEQLRTKLATRFADELIEQRLGANEAIPIFRELDGKLYAVAAGRGTDWTVESVDYRVELNAAKDGGRILADIHRREETDDGEWVSSNQIDQVEFPFSLADGGAVFSAFPTIW